MSQELTSLFRAFGRLETVSFDRHEGGLFQVVAFVDLAESSTPEQLHGQVPVFDERPVSFSHGAVCFLISESQPFLIHNQLPLPKLQVGQGLVPFLNKINPKLL